MCNLSRGIEQRGIEKGKIYGAILMCRDLDLSEEMILKKLHTKFDLTEEEAKKYLNETV